MAEAVDCDGAERAEVVVDGVSACRTDLATAVVVRGDPFAIAEEVGSGNGALWIDQNCWFFRAAVGA